MTVPGAALVTGGAGGIGAATARTLAAEGRPVAVLDRDADAVAAVADDLGASGHRVRALVADVADAGEVERAVTAAEVAVGPLDVLVNAAGVLPMGSLLDSDPADWARAFAVNSDGVFHVSGLRPLRGHGWRMKVGVGRSATSTLLGASRARMSVGRGDLAHRDCRCERVLQTFDHEVPPGGPP